MPANKKWDLILRLKC